jgi:hypothetical protein
LLRNDRSKTGLKQQVLRQRRFYTGITYFCLTVLVGCYTYITLLFCCRIVVALLSQNNAAAITGRTRRNVQRQGRCDYDDDDTIDGTVDVDAASNVAIRSNTQYGYYCYY